MTDLLHPEVPVALTLAEIVERKRQLDANTTSTPANAPAAPDPLSTVTITVPKFLELSSKQNEKYLDDALRTRIPLSAFFNAMSYLSLKNYNNENNKKYLGDSYSLPKQNPRG